jgi:hypothetical protein
MPSVISALDLLEVAECLAKHWKEALENRKVVMQQFTASDLADTQDEGAKTVSVLKARDTFPAQIIEHPSPSPTAAFQGTTASDVPTESVADAARRFKAEKEARKKQPKP